MFMEVVGSLFVFPAIAIALFFHLGLFAILSFFAQSLMVFSSFACWSFF